jgi:hypothetical protein
MLSEHILPDGHRSEIRSPTSKMTSSLSPNFGSDRGTAATILFPSGDQP